MQHKISDIRIHQIIREEMKKFLNEELSIATEVNDAVIYCLNKFKKTIYTFDYTFKGLDTIHIKGEPIRVSNPLQKFGGYFDVENMTVSFKVTYNGGHICHFAVREVLQHELEHVYQILKKRGKPKKITKHNYNRLYDMAINKYGADGSGNSKEENDIAKLFYFYSNFEQDAFANSLYAELMSSSLFNPTFADSIVRGSSAMTTLRFMCLMNRRLKELRELKNENYNDYVNALEPYEVSYDWMITLLDRAIKRLKQKIGHVVRKACIDKGKPTLFRDFNVFAILDAE